jgi:RimJ/RimL family protein N-acetyltransferase
VGIAEIIGPGVRLRPFRPDDAEAVVAGCSDPLSCRFMPSVPAPFTPRHAQTFLTEGVASYFAEGGAIYAVADPETDELLGGVSLDRVIPARGQAEIGYWVGPWTRRRGVAVAAVRALSEHALTNGLERLEVLTHWENGPSQRVALAAGFQREGVRRGALPNRDGGRDDLVSFARLAGDRGDPVPRLLPDLPGGELTDGVVTLRPLGPGDLAFMTAMRSLPEVVATSVPPVAPTPEQLRSRCERAEGHWLAGTRADLVVVDTASGEPAGELGLFYTEPIIKEGMIGYSMMPAYRGRGFMTRAAELIALWVFAETDIARLVAGTAEDNSGSQRVLQKAGFKREARMRERLPGPDGFRVDEIQFVLLAEDLLTEGPRLDG